MKRFKSFVVMLLLAFCVALTGVFGSINAARAQSAEVVSAADGQYLLVGELWNDVTKRFDETNLKTLFGLLTGTESPEEKTFDKLYGLLKAKLDSKTIKAQDIEKINNKNIEVTIGGLNWQVVFLSTDRESGEGQNIIVTLWLSSYQQSAWSEQNGTLGEYYGIVQAGNKIDLYSDWCADVYIESNMGGGNNKLNDYNTSYIRAVTLNNGGEYVSGATTKTTYQKSKDSIFALFTYKDSDPRITDALIDHIVTPANVYWQQNESIDGYNNLINENSLESGVAAAWGNDYLWLPSLSETGTYSSEGIWGLTAEQRENHNTSATNSVSCDTKVGTRNNYQGRSVYLDTYLRTGNGTGTQIVNSLYYKDETAHTISDAIAASSNVCRPAFNLNLTSAKDRTVDPKSISDDEGTTLADGFSLSIAPYDYSGGDEIDLNTGNITFKYEMGEGLETQVLVYGQDYLFEVYSDDDYTVATKPKDAGTYYIEFIGIGNYTGKYRTTFSVSKTTLDNSIVKEGEERWSDEDESGSIEVPYKRENYNFSIYVFDTKGNEVDKDIYNIEYQKDGKVILPQEFTDAGVITYTVSINTANPKSSNYDESKKIMGTITITPKEIESDDKIKVEVLDKNIIYNGEAQMPNYRVTYTWGAEEILLSNSVDYIGVFSDNEAAGQGKISITFRGNYSYKQGGEDRTYIANFEILTEAIEKIVIVYGEEEFEPNEANNKLLRLEFPTDNGYAITVKAIGTTGREIESNNLTFSWSGVDTHGSQEAAIILKNVCTANLSVKITDGNKNYTDTGVFTATIEIYAKHLSAEDVNIQFDGEGIGMYTYSDDREGINPNFELYFTDIKLKNSTDYTYTVIDNIDVGEATIQITLTGNYTSDGVIEKHFTIQPLGIDVSRVQWKYSEAFTFTGDAFTVELDAETIPEYVIVSYLENSKTHAGTYTAQVSFEAADANHVIRNDNQVFDLRWEIMPQQVNIDGASLEGKDLTFNNEYHKLEVQNLAKGVKATYIITNELGVRVDAQIGCRDVGSYTYRVTFSADNNDAHSDYILREGDANTEYTAMLNIKKLDFSNNSNLFNISLASKTWGYTGKDIKPTVIVTWRGTNISLRSGVDYYVTYENNREIGTNAKAIVHGMGNYDGQMEEIFTISVTGGGESSGGGTDAAPEGDGGTNIGLIIGVFAGVVAVFAVVIVVVVVVLKKRKNKNSDDL